MGTDIHGVFQKYDGSKWVDIESKYEFDRHYQLFAVLADVRNGVGFAGVKTGSWVAPIAEPRGLPEDFIMSEFTEEDWSYAAHPVTSLETIPDRLREYYPVGSGYSMGDHSFSWLTSEEMLNWFDNVAPTIHNVKTGVISRGSYDEWDKVSSPVAYSGGILGNGIIVVDDNDIEKKAKPNWTHVKVEWDSDIREELSYFFEEVRRLKEEHGKVRIVFGFDS